MPKHLVLPTKHNARTDDGLRRHAVSVGVFALSDTPEKRQWYLRYCEMASADL